MPISGYFDKLFAESGDITTVPDATQPDGSVSYEEGFGGDYALAYTDPDAKNIPRDKFNQILYSITSALQQYQQVGTPPFITSAMNNGSPYSYSKFNRCIKDGIAYQSLVDLNTDTPPSAKWIVSDIAQTNVRTRLTSSTTYYVATTGNDSNAGTVGAPWLTLQHAHDYIAQNIDLAGYNITVSVGAGTYTGALYAGTAYVGAGTVTYLGDTTTPSNVLINVTGSNCFTASGNGAFSVGGFKFQNTNGGHVVGQFGGIVTITGKCEFGSGTSNGYNILANFGAVIISSDLTFSGSIGTALSSQSNGMIYSIGAYTLTVSGTPAYSTAFALATSNANILLAISGFSGSATGARYNATVNGSIATNGGGANFFPGNSAGSTSTGGQYV